MEEVFPALFVKPKSDIKKEGWPTIILFSNNSYVLIGGTCYKKKNIYIYFNKTSYY